MENSERSGGTRGERFTDDHGEVPSIEWGVDSLGTPAAGAGPQATDGTSEGATAAPAQRTLQDLEAPGFLYTSDAGEQTGIEQGVQLTDEGQRQAAGPQGGETH
ncbi:MAG TPA: hypothetical protein VM536_22150 [Chloroflexia bacterium]|nr:hypothetical protein [Chloroflexia bacterium]